ncbi:MAG TPA: CHAT domain-containing protein [Burkholderiales bacterium]
MEPFRVRGVREETGAAAGLAASRFGIEPIANYELQSTRAAGEAPRTETLPDQHVMELHIELPDERRDFVLYTTQDQYQRDFRPAAGDDRGPWEPVPLIPAAVLPRRAGARERGPVGWILKRLGLFKGPAAPAAAAYIGETFEDRLAAKNGVPQLGALYQCARAPFALERVARMPASERPALLFIHGTASWCGGSFGDLWRGNRPLIDGLAERYAGRVYALEHRTLTESPVANAIQLLESLPAGAVLHVVTHSRGGLVGELLARGMRSAGAAFTPEEIGRYVERLDERQGGAPQGAGEALARLARLLEEKRPRVERFVRVACPARGTTLASQRFDVFLSVLAHLLGLVPGIGEVLDLFTDCVRALVAQKAKPTVLPGIEAMMPDSALVALLNDQKVELEGALSVIAGDIEGGSALGSLGVFLADLLFWCDHDLVVDTDSMAGGMPRLAGTWRLFDQGAGVNHFSYFGNDNTAQALLRALQTAQAGERPPGFSDVVRGAVPAARARGVIARLSRAADDGARPVVFLLPGIMGSELHEAGEKVWFAWREILRGGLGRIEMGRHVSAVAPLDDYYGELADFLAATHHVVPHAFDWRLSLEQAADALAPRVDAALQVNAARPLCFLAHSMGGLAVRALMARHPALWQRAMAHAHSRFIMLGTPNRGSHVITRLLVTREPMVSDIATLDFTRKHRDVVKLVAAFPGIYDMLPEPEENGAWDFFAGATWRGLHEREREHLFNRVQWDVPEPGLLQTAAALRARLRRQDFAHAARERRVIYVAGVAEETPCGITASGGLEFYGTTEGDGRVPWATGVPPGMDRALVYYMDEVHGDMARHARSFGAILELVQRGETALLPHDPPVQRSHAAQFVLADMSVPAADEAQAVARALGGRVRRPELAARAAPLPLKIEVVHGDLRYARHCRVVGHYKGYGLYSAERTLDGALDGQLQRRVALGLYPGPLGTSQLFFPRGRTGQPPALIVGLGEYGDLTPRDLEETIMRAASSYAVEALARDADGEALELGLSALLVGSASGGIALADAVVSMVNGVIRANQSLAEAAQVPVRIGKLEIVELWQDRALEACHKLREAQQLDRFSGPCAVAPEIRSTDGARSRIRYEEAAGWPMRLRIESLGGGKPGDAAQLKFTLFTERARAEARLLATERAALDTFVDRAIGTTRPSTQLATALFHLLLPNDLKEEVQRCRDMVLVVDESSAGYPWEMLQPSEDRPERVAPALNGAFVRQLEAVTFRPRPAVARDSFALVIGDPSDGAAGFSRLPGARAEAEQVQRALGEQGFGRTELALGKGGDAVIELLRRPWQVLHLAGHGVHQYGPTKASGMVLGEHQYLTAAIIGQMPVVPELVFINCCYLGRTTADGHTPFHRLAANIGAQLMRDGARAVVAAGWAVDDAAAVEFASAFYREMLAGGTFGRAVREARLACYRAAPYSNTWAAYQCYGDPDFRLTLPNVEPGTMPARPRAAQDLVGPQEAVQVLVDFVEAQRAGERRQGADWLRDLAGRLPAGWLERGDVLAALARAHGEIGDFAEAARLYQKAAQADAGSVSLEAMKELANLKARHAWDSFSGGSLKADAALKLVGEAIALLENLLAIGETRERRTLLASAYKRKAALAGTRAARREALQHMLKHAETASRLAARELKLSGGRREARERFLYAENLRLVADYLLRQLEPATKAGRRARDAGREQFRRRLARAQAEAKKQRQEASNLWDRLFEADLRVLEWLDRPRGNGRIDEVRDGFLEVLKRSGGGSPRERKTIDEQLTFIGNLLRSRSLAKRLQDLRDALSLRG